MNKIKFSVIDAFTNTPFTGNPAACVLTAEPLDEKTMQNIPFIANPTLQEYFDSDGEARNFAADIIKL
jgi:predicted PhzF superfamily epimerase YddE/YHI9